MKKYIIKYADGSRKGCVFTECKTRKEAGDSVMAYIKYHNENLNEYADTDSYLSPFDFSLEEVESVEVNEKIEDFDSAVKYLTENKYLSRNECVEDLVRTLLREINPHHVKALIALNQLFTIAEAWNKADGFVPDLSNSMQDKWFPWFVHDKESAFFVFANTSFTPSRTYAYASSRLCFKTAERAEQFGKQFEHLYNEVFLMNE